MQRYRKAIVAIFGILSVELVNILISKLGITVSAEVRVAIVTALTTFLVYFVPNVEQESEE